MIEFKLPSLGADMDEGTLIEWKVVPGQRIGKGDIVAVVDTTKAAVDVESWIEGQVHELLTQPGETVPVGTVMALLLAPGETAAAATRPGPITRAAARVAAVPAPGAAAASAAAASASAASAAATTVTTSSTRPRVSPAARRRADDLGVDLANLHGSGPEGAVTLRDVEATATATAAGGAPVATAAEPAATAHEGATPVPVARRDRVGETRLAIAAAMSRSKREIPHYYLAEAIPMRAALRWLAALNESRPVTARVLPAVLLLKAVGLSLRGYPELNGQLVDGEFRPATSAHIGVAISLRSGGLIAPALHDVAAKPIDRLMAELADLVKRTRAGSLRSTEMSNPTITVTNLGDAGSESVFGVIYPPQVALVGFGRIAERAFVDTGTVVAMSVVTASLAADHRVSDGHRGALFLGELRERLQHPETLDEDTTK